MSTLLISVAALIFGVLIGVFVTAFIVAVGVRYKSQKQEFAVAFWDEDKKVWQVRGRYLSIGKKIYETMKSDPEKVKYKY